MPMVLLLAVLRLHSYGSTYAFCHAEASSRTNGKRHHHSRCNMATTADAESLPFSDSPTIVIAVEAVRKACRITTNLQKKMDTIAMLTKDDKSPVTVGDFACQAVVLQHLQQHLPNSDTRTFLAEERSSNLTPELTKQILQAVGDATTIEDEESLRDCIDLGQSFYECSADPPSTFWCLDPIDGTKGFLRKGQYCVALGLLEDGVPTIGILGCPNLPFDEAEEIVGCIFVACKGRGCYQLDLYGAKPPKRIGLGFNELAPPPSTQARFCLGVERGFGDPYGKAALMAQELHGGLEVDSDEILHSVRMDSQAKYGVVARGGAEFYVRLPQADYQEWIWDVAPGALVLEEAYGTVTDANGDHLRFSCGAKLSRNYGVLGACSASLYRDLVQAYNCTGTIDPSEE